MRTHPLIAVAAAAVLAGSAMAAVPSAQAAPRERTLASGLVSPLSVAAAPNGTTYVTQNFAGTLERIRPGRAPRTVYRSRGGNEVGAVSVRGDRVVFAETAGGMMPTHSWLKRLTRNGKARTIANIRAFENRRNPDRRITYGARGISPGCAAQWPTEEAGPPVYRGIEDSHPYATDQVAGRTYVADAGMNAILSVTNGGRIRVVAVTPASPVLITAELAGQMGLPACAVGLTYFGESVPTDVERGRDGMLYVTTEGGGLGEMMPLGSLYRINPANGRVRKVVGGLFAPTGLAITGRGDVLVAQLFANEISRIKKGTKRVRRYASVTMPGALDWTRRGLYATTDVLAGLEPPSAPGGKVVLFRTRR